MRCHYADEDGKKAASWQVKVSRGDGNSELADRERMEVLQCHVLMILPCYA